MKEQSQQASPLAILKSGISRRKFFGLAGGAAAAGILISSCNPKGDFILPAGANEVDLGSGDVGILNYAYALEQLEAAFYTEVINRQFSGITPSERTLLTDIRDHEVAHREFFRKALGANAIIGLQVNFETIDFDSRDSVLQTAKAFEDLGVSAYNGAANLIVNPDYLIVAGKIVSVEARHAAYIRDLLSNGSFADSTVVDIDGLDMARNPLDVLAIAKPFLKSNIDASNLPTT